MSEFVCHKCGDSFDEMHKWRMDCLFLCRDCYDFLLDGRQVVAGVIQPRHPLVDGGPAFPGKICTGHAPIDEVPIYKHPPGMSLRDWFAGQALLAIAFSDGKIVQEASSESACKISGVYAEWSYQQADAMLAERERPRNGAVE